MKHLRRGLVDIIVFRAHHFQEQSIAAIVRYVAEARVHFPHRKFTSPQVMPLGNVGWDNSADHDARNSSTTCSWSKGVIFRLYFNFLESTQIKVASESSASGPSALSTNVHNNIVAASDTSIFVGSQSGWLYVLDDKFCDDTKVAAYIDGRIDYILPVSDELIATIGEELSGSIVLKVWSLRRSKSSRSSFKHLSSVTINTDQPYPITCCAALDDLSHVAIGFTDGKVILIKGDLGRDRGAKQRTVYKGEEPVTSLEFLASKTATTLYIFSTSKLLTLTIANAGSRAVNQVPRIMESVGAALNCVTKQTQKNEIIVVRQDAIYVYGVDGRGQCFAMEGPKSAVYVHEAYTLIIRPPNSSKAGTMKVLGKIDISAGLENASQITVLNTTNKFIAHSGYFAQGLKTAFSSSGVLYLLTLDGKLYQLKDIGIEAKLDVLFTKSMYTLALNLAQEASVEPELINSIYIRYGDYLYDKGDFEQSVKQYIRAIRQCQASTIMRKYLQAQHIPLLTEFLEALHTAKLSNSDYTTLLLNCYAKLNRRDKMTAFITEEEEHPIDLGIAVALCRQAGYYDEALRLSTKHKSHAICLGIMIEDKRDFNAALAYIRKLTDPADVGNMLNSFGRPLMLALPAETTKLFIDFYTGTFSPSTDIQATGVISPPRRMATNYGGAFYDSMVNSRYSQVLPSLPSLDMSLFNSMKRVTSYTTTTPKNNSVTDIDGASSVVDEKGAYVVPAPRTAFPIFADFPLNFIELLEAILERQTDTSDDSTRRDVVTTLLEVYLRQASNTSDETKQMWERKAKELMKVEADYVDDSNAVLIFHLSSFEEGSLLMQERSGRKEDVFRSRCTAGDTAGVIEVLRKYGDEEPFLYTLALKYFISSSKVIREAGSELGNVLSKIQEKRLLAPLQVIQALSSNSVATVGTVKEYLSSIIEKERKEIASNQGLVKSYREESEAKAREIADLAENARVLQVSRCSGCGGTLELPVVHFLCKHSFHQRCVPAAAEEIACPLCSDSSNAVKAIVKNKANLAEKQEFFKEGLAASRDKANFLFSRLDLSIEQATT